MASFFPFSFFDFLVFLSVLSSELSPNYYTTSCPKALSIIKNEVDAAVKKEARMGASLLRLEFHDCFVNGCDGSVLLDSSDDIKREKDALQNLNSLRGFEVIDDIKAKVESVCPGVVSCADILAIVARDSVVALGGPSWTVPLGRKDATTTSMDDASNNLPVFSQDLDTIISLFLKKGFTVEETVVLSGGHTIGMATCATFSLHAFEDKNLNSIFQLALKSECLVPEAIANVYPLDSTDIIFDNAYFHDLMNFKGVLRTDQELYNNASTDSIVKTYSTNSAKFFTDFGNAMIKLGNLDVLTGSQGEIRTNCRIANNF